MPARKSEGPGGRGRCGCVRRASASFKAVVARRSEATGGRVTCCCVRSRRSAGQPGRRRQQGGGGARPATKGRRLSHTCSAQGRDSHQGGQAEQTFLFRPARVGSKAPSTAAEEPAKNDKERPPWPSNICFGALKAAPSPPSHETTILPSHETSLCVHL